MSMIECDCCDRWADSDDGEGQFDVPHVGRPAGKLITYICGTCCDKYLTEDGKYDPDTPEPT